MPGTICRYRSSVKLTRTVGRLKPISPSALARQRGRGRVRHRRRSQLLEPYVPVLSLGVLYVFAVLPVAVALGARRSRSPSRSRACSRSTGSSCRRCTRSRCADSANWFALAVYLVTAVVVSELAGPRQASRGRGRAARARVGAPRRARDRAAARADLDEELDEIAVSPRRCPRRRARADRARRSRIGRRRRLAAPARGRGRSVATLYTPEAPTRSVDVQHRFLPALAALLAVAVDRGRLEREALEAEALRRSDSSRPRCSAPSRTLQTGVPFDALRARVDLVGVISAAAAVAFVTAAIAVLKPYVPVLSLGVLYELAVLAGRGALGRSARDRRLGREHARVQLVLPAADAHVPAAATGELARARGLPRHRVVVSVLATQAQAALAARGGAGGSRPRRSGAATRSRRPSCTPSRTTSARRSRRSSQPRPGSRTRSSSSHDADRVELVDDDPRRGGPARPDRRQPARPLAPPERRRRAAPELWPPTSSSRARSTS